MKKKIYTIRDGQIVEIKGKDLEKVNFIIMTEKITIKEFKERYPDKYQLLVDLKEERKG